MSALFGVLCVILASELRDSPPPRKNLHKSADTRKYRRRRRRRFDRSPVAARPLRRVRERLRANTFFLGSPFARCVKDCVSECGRRHGMTDPSDDSNIFPTTHALNKMSVTLTDGFMVPYFSRGSIRKVMLYIIMLSDPLRNYFNSLNLATRPVQRIRIFRLRLSSPI